MNHCGIQQKNTFTTTCEEMRNSVTVCPKPRRLSLFNSPINDAVRPLRWHMCYQTDPYESKASLDLLDIIFDNASSPPFFSGSPPSRVSNPLTQDTRFKDNIPESIKSSKSSPERKVGSVGGNFGNKPAVRVEGFDCVYRDTRNCGIPARA